MNAAQDTGSNTGSSAGSNTGASAGSSAGADGHSHTRATRHDRWAHRRGEPRLFAFLWTLFLLGATLLGFGSLGAIGMIDAGTYRAVARVILVSVAVGVVVVWPMTRLSQVTPARRATRAAFIDFIVIALPLQAVVLPQVFLPFGWSKVIVWRLPSITVAYSTGEGQSKTMRPNPS